MLQVSEVKTHLSDLSAGSDRKQLSVLAFEPDVKGTAAADRLCSSSSTNPVVCFQISLFFKEICVKIFVLCSVKI